MTCYNPLSHRRLEIEANFPKIFKIHQYFLYDIKNSVIVFPRKFLEVWPHFFYGIIHKTLEIQITLLEKK